MIRTWRVRSSGGDVKELNLDWWEYIYSGKLKLTITKKGEK
jgi:hypothetical protein